MYLAGDYTHPTPHKGRCRVRIYRPDLPEAKPGSAARDEAVVICTEPKDNPGVSITNAAERIAGEVISLHWLPTPLVWVEDLGSYRGEERKRIGEPSWKPLDRATVEALVGSPVL
jgi:hypothetical protein